MQPKSNQNISKIFNNFMTRVTMLDELVPLGGKLLAGFQQSFDVLHRPSMDRRSKLVENILKANETKRLRSYIDGGCIKVCDGIDAMTKLHSCLVELQDHLNKARGIVSELECLLDCASKAVEAEYKNLLSSLDDNFHGDIDQHSCSNYKENKASPSCPEPEVAEYAIIMAVIKNMFKQDFEMQERIINSLNHKSTSEELDSYSLMWSLRPFINDEIMAQAWKLVS